MKVTDYKIVYGAVDEVEVKVKALLKEGWQPSGVPFQFAERTDYYYSNRISIIGQVMIKEGKINELDR